MCWEATVGGSCQEEKHYLCKTFTGHIFSLRGHSVLFPHPLHIASATSPTSGFQCGYSPIVENRARSWLTIMCQHVSAIELLGSLCCRYGHFFSLQNSQEKAALHLKIIDLLLGLAVKLRCRSSVWKESIAGTCTKLANISLVIKGSCYRRQSSCILSMVYSKFLLQQVVRNVKMSTDISRCAMW